MESNPASSLDPKLQQQLHLVSVLHYAWGGLVFFSTVFGFIPVVLGLIFAGLGTDLRSDSGEPMPGWLPWVFVAGGLLWLLLGGLIGTLTIQCGRKISRFQGRKFGIRLSYFTCLSVPLGTALGVFTIMTLQKPEVKALFPD